jgi:predicted nucleotidyltransferase
VETALQKFNAQRQSQRESLRARVRQELRAALTELGVEDRVIVFGSLVQPGRFHEASDVDVAFETLPQGWSLYGLTGWLAERLGRRTDVILLTECRFRPAIEREGELWTSSDWKS